MQKWRNWEAAGKADRLLALKREPVIAPLAVQPKVGVQLVDEAALELGWDVALSTNSSNATVNGRKPPLCFLASGDAQSAGS
jgi:hypothetical protein